MPRAEQATAFLLAALLNFESVLYIPELRVNTCLHEIFI